MGCVASRHLGALALAAALAALGVAPSAAAAQECRPPTGSNEAKLLAFFSAPVSFSPAGAPETLHPGAVVATLEVAPVPPPPADIERTSYCYNGVVAQTRLAPALPRPRLAVGLPAGFALEGSYVPPLTVADAQPNLASLALSFTRVVGGGAGVGQARLDHAQSGVRPEAERRVAGRPPSIVVMLRAQGSFGRVRGPITCPSGSLQQGDPAAPCYGREASRDTFSPNMIGLEGALAVRPGAVPRLALYGGGGVTRLMPRFRVGFRDGLGGLDTTRVLVSLNRGTLFGGATFKVAPAIDLSTQLYSVPADALTWRFAASYRVR